MLALPIYMVTIMFDYGKPPSILSQVPGKCTPPKVTKDFPHNLVLNILFIHEMERAREIYATMMKF